jgi:hypothetical protein
MEETGSSLFQCTLSGLIIVMTSDENNGQIGTLNTDEAL